MSNLNLTFGTDPEVAFVQGYPASVLPAGVVYKNVGVTDPITLMDGTIIADGAAMEFQPQAAMDIQELVDNLRSLIKYGDDMLNTYLQRNGRPGRESPDIVFMPEVPIDLSWCDEDPDLAVFGCSPDQSAYGEECRPGTIDASKHPWRYFGCHIHIGVFGDARHFQNETVMHDNIKALDRTVGLASTIISDNKDARRRAIYGRPGVYRHQPHGLEYRTPSNMILRSPEWLGYIFQLADHTVHLVEDGVYPELAALVPDELVVATLRSGNMEIARETFSRVATAFSLPEIPDTTPVNWRVEWLT